MIVFYIIFIKINLALLPSFTYFLILIDFTTVYFTLIFGYGTY